MRAHVEPERVNWCFLLKCEFGFGQSWKDTESGPAGKAGYYGFHDTKRGSVVHGGRGYHIFVFVCTYSYRCSHMGDATRIDYVQCFVSGFRM